MTFNVQVQRLCQVQIQKLLLVVGIMVTLVIVFQFINSTYEKNILVVSQESNISRSLELSSSPTVNEVVSTRIASYLDEDTVYKSEAIGENKDYELDTDDNESIHHSFQPAKTIQANNLTPERGLIHNKSSTMRHVRSSDKSSTIENEIKLNFFVIEQIKKSDFTFPQDNGHKPGTLLAELELSNHSLGTVTLRNKAMVAGNTSVRKYWNKAISITDMTASWLQISGATTSSKRVHWSSSQDRELQNARLQIKNVPEKRNLLDLHASVFQNVSMFKRSYDLMERTLKVYVYNEGEKPIFHNPKMRGIYASEGWFMSLMEKNKQFVVRDPRKAHLFYLPFSSKMLRISLLQQNYSSQMGNTFLKNYIDLIAKKYRFWNRTSGADHFLVACHDWAPKLTRNHMDNCIRALCNSNLGSGFRIGKDVSLPVTFIRTTQDPQKDLGGNPPLERRILAFFAGSMHGYLRPVLLQYWNNRERDMIITGPMNRSIEGKARYRELMKNSKYCICARGYEVHTPRLIESIFYECVPVIISDNYVPPFLEVLKWETFSVFVLEKDIPNLRSILLSISEEKYLAMQHRIKMVQQHFLWHKQPVRYDLFHMILHSVWYNRLFQLKPK
ncbi:putative glycosyltransferase At3g07620 [Apium graveolens]|uniref:putative glycosyltransferase At3g07620 n=1 Tax=Apium graveolens TaxID=4045 RepID=UPI003D7A0F95